jgi:hypothetical protein
MKAVLRHVRKAQLRNSALAFWAANLIRGDTSKALSPEVLHQIQTMNLSSRQICAAFRADLKRRRSRRASRITSRFGSSKAVHQARREHDQAIKALEGVFEQFEAILFQIGDACAWAVLGGQTRVLMPLYKKGGNRHPLPTGAGLEGPLHVLSKAHATGNFLVLHNDLTNCLCIGDLTFVSVNRPWRHPSVFEVKTTEPDKNDRSTIGLFGAKGGWPVDVEMLLDIHTQLGFAIDAAPPLDERGERQWREITERAELMQNISASGLKPLSADGRTLWSAVERVLVAALRTGYTYDQVEPGVYMIAVRNRELGEFQPNFEAAFTRLRDDVFSLTPKLGWTTASTSQLWADTAGAPLFAPLLLWRIPAALSAYVAANELVLMGYVREDVWPTLFAERGIERAIDEDGQWLLRRGDALVTFRAVEVAKITAGVIFSGISPIAVADAVDADLTGQATVSAPTTPAG